MAVLGFPQVRRFLAWWRAGLSFRASSPASAGNSSAVTLILSGDGQLQARIQGEAQAEAVPIEAMAKRQREDLIKQARRSRVNLVIAMSSAIRKTIAVPAEALLDVAATVEANLSVWSPFAAADVVTFSKGITTPQGPAIEIALLPSKVAENAFGQALEAGLEIDRIALADPTFGSRATPSRRNRRGAVLDRIEQISWVGIGVLAVALVFKIQSDLKAHEQVMETTVRSLSRQVEAATAMARQTESFQSALQKLRADRSKEQHILQALAALERSLAPEIYVRSISWGGGAVFKVQLEPARLEDNPIGSPELRILSKHEVNGGADVVEYEIRWEAPR